MSVPPAAILGGLLILTSFIISHSVISVPGTDWIEPALIWLIICMPTGSHKTTIYQFLRKKKRKIFATWPVVQVSSVYCLNG